MQKANLSNSFKFLHFSTEILIPLDSADLKTFLKEITSNSKYGEAKEIEISINQPWQNKIKVPDQVLKSALARGINISVEKWRNLNELDRFAFCKLVRPTHEHNNLDRAFAEILK